MTILSDIIRRSYRTGQEEDPVERCTSGIKDADLKTGQARKDAFRRAAECVADGYCSTYGVPPGVCSSVVGPVAEEIANAADSVGQAFANGFEIQGAAGPTIEQRETWAKNAFGKAIFATRDMRTHLFASEGGPYWDIDEAAAYWLKTTAPVSTEIVQRWYDDGKISWIDEKRPYVPGKSGIAVSRDYGSMGMTREFFFHDYSTYPGPVVNADVRAGLNSMTQNLVKDATEARAKKRIITINPSFIAIFDKPELTTPQKIRRVAAYGSSLWLLWKLIGIIRR